MEARCKTTGGSCSRSDATSPKLIKLLEFRTFRQPHRQRSHCAKIRKKAEATRHSELPTWGAEVEETAYTAEQEGTHGIADQGCDKSIKRSLCRFKSFGAYNSIFVYAYTAGSASTITSSPSLPHLSINSHLRYKSSDTQRADHGKASSKRVLCLCHENAERLLGKL
jgi:hypothetical protein